ncbi:hypothetical protein PLESTB_000359500 [Pleodorina starrii]|uniref:BAH domain-containing protein n=1 Tax=Pleodorina starrii TaxID=330485 RepID=A0A9W6BEC7_9CHLO|nr:hypothetical protein PLESTM_000035900 [Pleodorina starrii]GLC50255.1 hypothetical protein PLESTB_000359500 [Pleodorina starrii]GLC64362.1 hypothetical protein PLESTF_000153200 [Pleodorina starrii]
MGKARVKRKAAEEEEEMADDSEESDDDDSAGEGIDENDLERDSTGKLTGVRISNSYVEAKKNYFLRRFSMVLVQAGENEHKFLGFIRELVEKPDDVEALICWFYRASDVKEVPPDLVICRARMEGKHGGGDKGRFKELFFSNHCDMISVQSVMHPIKVWLLPSESLDPVTVPPEAGPLAAAAAAAGHAPLLPGFVCRRMYDTQNRELFPLSEIPSRRKKLGEWPWLFDDVAELLRRSEVERQECMREWVRKCQMRAARAGAEAGKGEAGAKG